MVNTELLGDRATLYVKNMANDLGIFDQKKITTLSKAAAKLTPAQVNKKMISMSETVKNKKKQMLTDDIKKQIATIGVFKKDRIVQELKNKKSECIANVDAYVREWSKHLALLADTSRRLRAVLDQDDTNPLEIQVSDILENPFFNFLKVEGESIQFTTSDVVMRWEKKAANVNYTINLGKFTIKLIPATGAASVLPYQNNLKTPSNYIHPHVQGTNGSTCWGNASAAIKKMAEEGDIRPAMAAIEAFLHTYNDDSAYEDIYKFEEQRKHLEILKTKSGDSITNIDNVNETGLMYCDIDHWRLSPVLLLKYKPRYNRTHRKIFLPYFKTHAGAQVFLLEDGSSILCSKVLSDWSRVEQRGARAKSFDDVISEVKSVSEYYKEEHPELDISELISLSQDGLAKFRHGIKSGYTWTAIMKEAKDAD